MNAVINEESLDFTVQLINQRVPQLLSQLSEDNYYQN